MKTAAGPAISTRLFSAALPLFSVALLCASGWLAPQSVSAAPTIQLTVVIEQGAPATAAQQWGRLFSEAGLRNVSIRSARPGARIEKKASGQGDFATYRVTGAIGRGGTLELPGGRFRLGDRAGIKRWAANIAQSGGGGGEAKGAFGLTATELVAVEDALKLPITFKTKGAKSFDVLKKMASDQIGRASCRERV